MIKWFRKEAGVYDSNDERWRVTGEKTSWALFDIKKSTEAYKRALEYNGTSVVISKSPCIILENRNKRKRKEKINTYQIDQDKCKKCKTCIGKFGCPAIYFEEDESIHIDINQCNGCGNCATICPFKAIYKEEN